MTNDWWSNIMFGYIYPDGEAEPKDEAFLKELSHIAKEYENTGLRFCNGCDSWVNKNQGCWSCEY